MSPQRAGLTPRVGDTVTVNTGLSAWTSRLVAVEPDGELAVLTVAAAAGLRHAQGTTTSVPAVCVRLSRRCACLPGQMSVAHTAPHGDTPCPAARQ